MDQERTTLYDLILAGGDLTQEERQAAWDILGKHCRWETKTRLWNKLGILSIIPRHGILQRLIIRPYVHYIAGQSYPDEIKIVRDIVLDR